MFGIDADFKALLTSQEYAQADPEMRKVIMKAYQAASPEDRKRFVHGDDQTEGLTLAKPQTNQDLLKTVGKAAPDILKHTAVTTGKEGAAMAIDTLGQAGGAALGAATPIPGGAVFGEVAGAVGANQLNKALGLRQGQAGKFDTSDLLAGGVPAAVRAGQGIWKRYLTKPAQQAIQTADAETAANKAAWQTKRTQAQAEGNTALTKADVEATEANQRAQQQYTADTEAYETKRAQAQRTGEESVSRSVEQARTRAENSQADLTAYQQRLIEHNKAARDTYGNATQGMDIPDPKPAYEASGVAATKAKPVDVSSLNKTATEGAEFLEGPVDPQNPVSRIATALKSWGAGKPTAEATSPILDASGQPVRSTVAATPSTVPVDELIEVHQDLGRAIGKASGKQLKVLTDLYKQADVILKQHAKVDPAAAKAYAKHLEGQALFKRQKSFEEVEEAINSATSPRATGDPEVDVVKMRKNLQKVFSPGTFASEGITPAEQKRIWAEVGKVPTSKPGKEPKLQTFEPGGPEVRSPYPGPKPEAPTEVQPDYSKAKSPYVGPEPEAVKPDVAKTPWGRLIMARAIGGDAVAQVMGQAGNNFVAGMAILVGVGAPVWVSNTLLKSAKGQQIVRNIMKNKGSDATKLAALTTAARSLGGKPEDEAK